MAETPAGRTVPATPLQQALWWVHHRGRNRSVYMLTWRLGLSGPLDRRALRTAWQAAADRYSALRASFELRDDRVVQHVQDRVPAVLEEVDVDDAGAAPPATLLRLLAEELHERPVPMDRAPLGQLSVVRVEDQEELLVSLHHTVVDGWGMQLLLSDLSRSYQAATRGEPVPASGEPVSVHAYAEDVERARTSGLWEPSIAYWRKKLAGAVSATVVADRPNRPGRAGGTGGVLRYSFSAEAADAVSALSEATFATPFAVLLAALQIALHRGGAGEDVSVGVIVANRMSARDQELVGYLANLALVRSRVQRATTMRRVVEQVRDGLWESLAHQAVPFPLVYAELDDETRARIGDTPPIITTYHGPIASGLRIGEVAAQLLESPTRTARTHLGIGVFAGAAGFTAEVEYDTGRYDATTVVRLLQDVDDVLVIAHAEPDRAVGSVDVRSRTARHGSVRERASAVTGAPAADLPGGTAVGALVRRVWEQGTGGPPADADEDFFAAGGQSLKVLELATVVQAETGRELDLVDWLRSPTPARLAAALRDGGEVEAGPVTSTLAAVRDGAGPHVHLVPGAGGGLFDYQNLVAALPASWQVTQSHERQPQQTVEELARRFRDDLDSAGLRPDLLVGWSMGGVVAYEMLAGWGEAPPRLALLDAPPPVGYAPSVVEQDELVGFAATVCASAGVQLSPDALRVWPPDDRELAARVLAGFLAAAGTPVEAPVLQARWDDYRRHRRMAAGYVASHRVDTPCLVVAADLLDGQLDQWVDRLGGSPQRLRVDADHVGVLQPPAVTGVASALAEFAGHVPAR
ncbi:MAG TPA: condensation domain-containing protein [Micromonosporaceae bacterium]|nr:condensation domain-containing protein [Micromonosporaceae bacterium]